MFMFRQVVQDMGVHFDDRRLFINHLQLTLK